MLGRLYLFLFNAVLKCYNITLKWRYKKRYAQQNNKKLVWDGSYTNLITLLENILQPVITESFKNTKDFFQPPKYISSIHYSKVEKIETFTRSFIGLSYLFYACEDKSKYSKYQRYYKEKILEGMDPSNKLYWGIKKHLLIENTSLIIGFLLNEKYFWDDFTKSEKQTVLKYFSNYITMPCYENNWLWFKLFHLAFLEKFSQETYEEQIKELLVTINTMHVGDGWYTDGAKETSAYIDYYTPWAMQYYGLVFAHFFEVSYPQESQKLNSLGNRFAETYQYFFTPKGSHPIFGRSLLYRFASLSPFAYILNNNWKPKEGYDWLRTALCSEVNIFLENGALNNDGFLTMGLLDSDENVLENYSGSGSAYWSLKMFSLLLLGKEHPFWRPSDSYKSCPIPKIHALPLNNQILVHNAYGDIFLLNGANASKNYTWKYSKFVSCNISQDKASFFYNDNIMHFNTNNKTYFMEKIIKSHCEANYCYFQWESASSLNISVSTHLIALEEGYFFYHEFDVRKEVYTQLSGFGIAKSASVLKNKTEKEINVQNNEDKRYTHFEVLSSNMSLEMFTQEEKEGLIPSVSFNIQNKSYISGVCLYSKNYKQKAYKFVEEMDKRYFCVEDAKYLLFSNNKKED